MYTIISHLASSLSVHDSYVGRNVNLRLHCLLCHSFVGNNHLDECNIKYNIHLHKLMYTEISYLIVEYQIRYVECG